MDLKKNLGQKGDLLRESVRRIINRDFKGYFGSAVKNSLYQSYTTFVGKIGGLLFVIILARLLNPELYGLYSLIIATIFIFISLTDFSISSAIVKYLSKTIEKNSRLAKGYFKYLLKLKILLVSALLLIFIISSKFIADNYYHKPIFFGLLAGSIYMICFSMIPFFEEFFRSLNNFKLVFFKEIFTQLSRFIIVLLIVYLLLDSFSSIESKLALIFLSLSLSYFFSLIFVLFLVKRKAPFLKEKEKKLNKKQVDELKFFILPLSLVTLSQVLFSSVNILILGRYVSAEFIAYYQTADTLIGAIAPFLAFSVVLFPIFSRLSSKKLEVALEKSITVITFISAILFLIVMIFAPLIINLTFGSAYSQSAIFLRIFSFLLFGSTLTTVYVSYFISLGKTKIVAKWMIAFTIINIILDYVIIILLINYSELLVTLGIAIVAVAIKFLLLAALIFSKRKIKKSVK